MDVKDITKDAVLISEEATFTDALRKMITEQTNTLLVVDTDGALCGEVGVTDLLDAIVPEHLDGDSIETNFATTEMFQEAVKNAAEKPVHHFMSRDFTAVDLRDGLMAVTATAIGHQRARIPVVDSENRPIGIISRRGLKQILGQFLGIDDVKQ